jgi:ribosomal protein L11 methyltransferase
MNPLDSPYAYLHVYLIDGVVTEEDERLLGEAFIGTWLEDDTSFLFFSRPGREEVLGLIGATPNLRLTEEHRFTYEEWHGGPIEPVRVERFLIAPAWKRLPVEPGVLEIVMDPGVVFGTGLHPTTRDCLKAMLHVEREAPLGRVLDLGTGTGILAVAAAMLGADEVVAVDLNPLCVKTAMKNVKLNRLDGKVLAVRGKAEDFSAHEAHLVIANLHYDVLGTLLKAGAFRRGKWTIFSGLLRSQAEEFKSRLASSHLQVVREWDHERTWFTLLVKSGGT